MGHHNAFEVKNISLKNDCGIGLRFYYLV